MYIVFNNLEGVEPDLEISSRRMFFFLDDFQSLFIISANMFGEGKSDGP
jgi:hypothetical protein